MSHAAGLFVYGDYSLDKWSPKTKERPVSISLFCVVPLTGLEPVRILLHGILRLIYEGYTTIYCAFIE